ncbi:MAG: TIGR02757 family protein [Deltaproteobacteria bacterium]|nr:TIGR02757 family protein [Deltaproteobacteria bacterium]
MVLPRGDRGRKDGPGSDPRAEDGRGGRDRRISPEQGHSITNRTIPKSAGPLERLLSDGRGADLSPDPVLFPHRYADPGDAEAAAFIAATFAFGGVLQIRRFLDRLFAVLSPSPRAALVARTPLPPSAVAGMAHRFISQEGVHRFLRCLRAAYLANGTLERLYLAGRGGEEPELRRDLSRFLAWFRSRWGDALPAQRDFLFPRPERGSACKRHNLFLRWVSRGADGVDLGLWTAVTPADLIVPLDTHMARFGGWLGLTSRKTPDWRMAEEITAALRSVCPDDPVKFDYPLTRIGILGSCTRSRRGVCGDCPVAPLCSRKASVRSRK